MIEGVNDYDGDVWNVVLILELDQDGLDLRERVTTDSAQPLQTGGLPGSNRSSHREGAEASAAHAARRNEPQRLSGSPG